MEHCAGIDVSLELSSVCVVDAQGKIVKEAKVASDPEDLIACFASLGFAVKRIGLEAGPLSQWLQSGLRIRSRLLETRIFKISFRECRRSAGNYDGGKRDVEIHSAARISPTSNWSARRSSNAGYRVDGMQNSPRW